MMGILDWHLGRTVLKYIGMVLGVLIGLFLFMEFLDEVSRIGTGNYGMWELIKYLVLSLPRLVYELFPMAALLGTMLGLSTLAIDSELIVMRASGISIVGIAISVLKTGVIIILTAVLIGEFIAPGAETLAQRGRAEALQKTVKQKSDFGLWLRDKGTFVQVGEMLPDLKLLNIKIFEFDEERRLRAVAVADEGRFDQNRWVLTNLRQSLFADNQIDTVHVESAQWQSVLGPEILRVFLVRPEQLSATELRKYIGHLKKNAQNTDRYELAFWEKLASPLDIAVMVLLGIPFVFRHVRSGGLGVMLFTGMMLGLTFFAMAKGFGFLVLIYGIPPIVGAFTPTVIFLAVALALMRKVA